MRLLATLDPAAEAAGLRPGQKLADARAICPGLAILDADPAADRAALVRLAAWCERFTPLAAADPPDGLWLDITGCAHLWGGEHELAQHIAARLAKAGFTCRLAIADTAGAAWALARMPGAATPAIVPPGAERAALLPAPIACLRLPARLVAGLRRMGLRTVGEMARLQRAELSARFGPLPVRRLDQALGTEAEAIAWPHPPPPWEERLAFAEPILTPEDLARALAVLATRLCTRLAAQQAGGHWFTAEFFRIDAQRPAITVGTARPVREAAYLTKLLTAKIETVDPGFGVEAMALSADGVNRLVETQTGLHGTPDPEDGLVAVIDQLANRLSPDRLWRMAPQGSHVPERRVVRVAPLAAPLWPAEPGSPRPVRLLTRPEPIEVTAPVPDDPPLQFRWRGVVHRVRAAAGPERIAREWWRGRTDPGRPEADRVRDYYRVEDTEGARFWMFRVGLSGAPRWFLHGLFG